MRAITIEIPPEVYRQLEEEARKVGKAPEDLTRELLEAALHAREEVEKEKAREVLRATGRLHPLSESLRRKIIPGVTLDEVRKTMTQAGGPSLSKEPRSRAAGH
ncbi:MAG: hypothetical protein EXS64_14645 [Candidatus Latescibacteria bacterium]|nr:hypothetical protein [Candidatus Latescibacterota bacterium]